MYKKNTRENKKKKPLGESNPSFKDENLASKPIDERAIKATTAIIKRRRTAEQSTPSLPSSGNFLPIENSILSLSGGCYTP